MHELDKVANHAHQKAYNNWGESLGGRFACMQGYLNPRPGEVHTPFH